MRRSLLVAVAGVVVALFGGVSAGAGQAALVESKLMAPKFAEEGYGSAVAVAGSVAVVGMYSSSNTPGVAEVFTRSGGSWLHAQTLAAADGAPFDEFGRAVAVSGSVVVVGAPDHAGGAAYVFTENGGSWTQAQELTPSNPVLARGFGGSVAASAHGATILVGGDSLSSGGAGAVYVFAKSGGSWTQSQRLVAKNPQSRDRFGAAVAVSGHTAVIGVPGRDLLAGIADVFTESAGIWSEQARLKAPHPRRDDSFGSTVAISGSQAIVGAPYHAKTGGAAYAFGGPSWRREQALPCPNAAGGQIACGWSVAVSGTSAVVGAPRKYTQTGVVEEWTRTRAGWTHRRELEASNAVHRDWFGMAVAVSGPVIVVGAPFKGASNQGAAFAYTG